MLINKLTLSDEQEAALKLLESGSNVFLTGKAGTGKSTVIEAFRKRTDKSVLFVAPTGVAAMNIGGQTIHSCFQIPPGRMSDIEPLQSRKRFNILRNTDVIVVDEISMVRSDLLTAMDVRLSQVASGSNRVKPFGGKQIVVVGDFHQLPPVIESSNMLSYLCSRYGGVYAFQTAAWRSAKFIPVQLTHIHRQSDEQYIDILNQVRVGDPTAIEELNKLAITGDEYADESIVLSPYKAVVDTINMVKLAEINSPSKRYKGVVEGRFTKDLPVDADLELRVGARVMLAANRTDSNGNVIYSNGELATVSSLAQHSVTVRTDGGKIFTLAPYQWEMFDYDYSGTKVESKLVGTYTQIPLRLAWAVTIHKSQGCTFDNIVLNLGKGCFAPGQLYTALSRVRSLSGLKLTRQAKSGDVQVDRDIVKFYSEL